MMEDICIGAFLGAATVTLITVALCITHTIFEEIGLSHFFKPFMVCLVLGAIGGAVARTLL